ncbi:MAG TPA: phosphoribosyltransferase family protein [Bryobacteraceae bacterium]|nr:phosphoribosyltransferase family protein [Bryobacteraceae bacterium]
MSVEIKPQVLRGPWNSGFALHVHSLSSTYLGDDEYGHPRFSTTRSPVGELLYQLKYRNNRSAIGELAEAAAYFCKNKWHVKIDAIIPVPPTQARRLQPVRAIAEVMAALLNVRLCAGLKKVKKTPQLKDLTDYHERKEALQDAFRIDASETKGRHLLLFDDLYGSGATVRTIAEALLKQGGAKSVHLLTLTKKASG